MHGDLKPQKALNLDRITPKPQTMNPDLNPEPLSKLLCKRRPAWLFSKLWDPFSYGLYYGTEDFEVPKLNGTLILGTTHMIWDPSISATWRWPFF